MAWRSGGGATLRSALFQTLAAPVSRLEEGGAQRSPAAQVFSHRGSLAACEESLRDRSYHAEILRKLRMTDLSFFASHQKCPGFNSQKKPVPL